MPEHYFYISSNGDSYKLNLTSDKRDVLSIEGTGLPPIEYISERGPFQHGETVKDYFLRPRIVQYIIRQNFCSREDAYAGRTSLLNAIRPNKPGGPVGTLRHILPNGEHRDLAVVPLEGPRFEPQRSGRWDEWSIQETLRFLAHNPIFYNPTQKTETFGPCGTVGFPYTFPFPFGSACELVFPITFPITFEGFDVSDLLDNDGNWEDYPTILVYGPASGIRITNVTTDEELFLNASLVVPAGDYLRINLAYDSKVVELGSGTNVIQYLSSESDLATWHLEPGDNDVRIQIDSYAAPTYAEIRWQDRWLGV